MIADKTDDVEFVAESIDAFAVEAASFDHFWALMLAAADKLPDLVQAVVVLVLASIAKHLGK